MAIRNRLTQILGIEHPVLLAPMDVVSGGRLAAAVSHAGGLGLLGGGYGDGDYYWHHHHHRHHHRRIIILGYGAK